MRRPTGRLIPATQRAVPQNAAPPPAAPAPEVDAPILAAYVFEPWRELAAFAILLVELSWVTPWFLLLSSKTAWLRGFSVLAVTLLLGYSLARLLEALRLKLPYRIGAFLLFEALAVLFSLKQLLYADQLVSVGEAISRAIQAINNFDIWIPREFGVTLLVLLLCQRAAFLARRSLDPGLAENSFLVGAGALVFLGAISVGMDTPGLGFFPLFLIASLLALAASRLATLNRRRGGQTIPFDRPRLAGLLGSVFAVGAVALIVGLVLRSKPAFAAITFIYIMVVRIVLFLLVVLMSPAMLLLTLIFPQLRDARSSLPLFSLLSDFLKGVRGLLQRLPLTPLENFFRQLSITKPLLLWLALGLVLLASLAYLRLRITRNKYMDDWLQEDLDQDESADALAERLRRNLNRLMGQLAARLGLARNSRAWAAERIRRIYAELCETASQNGRPRKLSATPLEYLPELQSLYPQTAGDVATITAAYLRVRYGELPEMPQEVQAIENAWLRVKAEANLKPDRSPS